MARYIEIKGKAKTYVAIAVLAFLAWSLFGQSYFSANLGVFNRGYHASFLRGGHFEKRGVFWDQQNHTVGHIISAGGESLLVDLDAEISRGTLVVFAWRWPAFLFDEPLVLRGRFNDDASERLQGVLDQPGVYTLSVSGIFLRGDIAVDWWIEN